MIEQHIIWMTLINSVAGPQRYGHQKSHVKKMAGDIKLIWMVHPYITTYERTLRIIRILIIRLEVS